MDVLFLSPSYPADIPLFVSGLAAVGARVIGVGDQPVDALPERSKQTLSSYVQIGSWADEDAAIQTVLGELAGRNVDLVETLWEPTMLMAARLRELPRARAARQQLGTPDAGLHAPAPPEPVRADPDASSSRTGAMRLPATVRPVVR